ncbi:SDR family oxidoreductase [Kineococcus sp. SYSU DK004]|uniref:SDR family oxidoreductase n=1 Tax=Kineococcus sp. SYSU DK004 TaxID=3383125 RepID=UPI003D7EF435
MSGAGAGAEAVHPDLAGAVAVVTGGGRGLGLSTARALTRQGCHVALLDVLADVEDTGAELASETGLPALGRGTDVTDADDLRAAFGAVAERLGTPRVLVTAAGIAAWADAEDQPPEQWRRVVDVNLTGTFLACQAFARHALPAGRGAVVTVGSMSASIVNVPQHQAAYNAAKAGVEHLTRSLAVEWAARGLRVNAVSPGYMLSDMTRQFTDANPDLRRRWEELTPMGRMGEPSDLDGVVAFLASDASRFVTGQALVVDGGYTLL